MTHLDWSAWYVKHPRDEHNTQIHTAGNQLQLCCHDCGVSQSADDVSAGNEVA